MNFDPRMYPKSPEEAFVSDETRGVPVRRYSDGGGWIYDEDTPGPLDEYGRWLPADDASLLEAVAEASIHMKRVWGDPDSIDEAEREFLLAVEALAAHRALLDGGRREGASDA